MNFKDIVSLHEAYAAVYDEELRDELESSSIQEDLSFIDDLSDNELDQVMEGLFVSGDIGINECFDSLDYVLSEARVTSSDDRSSGSARVTASSERPSRVARTAERQRQVRIGRIAQAAQRTGERLAAPARSTGGTSASARVGQASQKVRSAAQQVKGFLGKVGRTAKAGYEAAKKEFSGQAGREAQARTTGRQMRRLARRQASAARGRDTSEFERKPNKSPSDPWSGSATKPSSRPSVTTKTTKALPGSPVRAALPPAKESDRKAIKALPGSPVRAALPPARLDKRGRPFNKGNYQTASSAQNRKLAKRLGEDFDLLAEMILEDLINEGYAQTFEQAVEVFESFSDYEISQIVENYLVEEREDLYDVVLEHLLNEGFAENEEAAAVIMANMSEEWREEILDEAADNVIMTVKSPSGQERSKIYKGASRPSDSHRHENPEQIANRRFSQQLADRKKEREERMRAGRLTVATKRAIEAATNRSDRTDFTPGSALRANERDGQPTDYRARRRRASGR